MRYDKSFVLLNTVIVQINVDLFIALCLIRHCEDESVLHCEQSRNRHYFEHQLTIKMKTLLLLIILIQSCACFGQVITPPKEKLSVIDIEKMNVSQLSILKNSIYASHGMTFNTYELHTLFMKQKWYKPSEKYKESKLTHIDTYNIDLITKQENLLRASDYDFVDSKKRVKVDNVYNLFQYPNFSEHDKEMLSKNGFIVYPTKSNQLFHIYENNDYLGVPSFITVDAILQLYHLYFDMTLRTIEEQYLLKKIEILTNECMHELLRMQSTTQNRNIQKAIMTNLALLGVCQSLGNEKPIKLADNIQKIINAEVDKCRNHNGFEDSQLLGRKFDYSQFVPRGHYTRNEKLKKYFLAMTWLGNAGLEISDSKMNNTLAAIILTHVLHTTMYQGKPLIEIWKDIYEPTVFYVGLSDDTGPVEIKNGIDNVFNNVTTIDDFDNADKLKKLVLNMSSGRISGHGSWGKQNKQFRLMGQRFVPDSYIFNRLTNEDRRMPNSLDIMAGLGNKKAYSLMMNEYKSSWEMYPSYKDSLDQIVHENSRKTKNDWTYNLYYHWIYNLKSLFDIKDTTELPFFMTTEGWERKTLNTALASWAELRHNTILYAKQSYVAECGGDNDSVKAWIPEPPKGYVEPNVEFYERMLSLMKLTIDGLSQREMLESRVQYIGKEFVDLLDFLRSVSMKENKKIPLSLQEYDQIQKLGSLLDNLTLRVLSDDAYAWDEVQGPDKNMPVIADVHTADNIALEVGVGYAHAMYVIVEIEGKLKLTRGAIFSFYEFPWQISDRLDDKKWQKLLQKNAAPQQPQWIDYRSKLKIEQKLLPLYKPDNVPDSSTEPGWKMIEYGTGC